MCCRFYNDRVKRLIIIAVLGIFVFASYSLSASFAFTIHKEFDHDQKNSSQYLCHAQTEMPKLPGSPELPGSEGEGLPVALRSLCVVFSSPGTLNHRTRNKTLLQFAERFLPSDNDSSPLSAILESSFYSSKNYCVKAFLSVKTTRKLE